MGFLHLYSCQRSTSYWAMRCMKRPLLCHPHWPAPNCTRVCSGHMQRFISCCCLRRVRSCLHTRFPRWHLLVWRCGGVAIVGEGCCCVMIMQVSFMEHTSQFPPACCMCDEIPNHMPVLPHTSHTYQTPTHTHSPLHTHNPHPAKPLTQG